MKQTALTINGLNDQISFCEAQGLAKCFEAYANECAGEYIMHEGIGFNLNSGYVYIALENGIQICSMLGRDAEFLITDFETGAEMFFNSFDEALNSL